MSQPDNRARWKWLCVPVVLAAATGGAGYVFTRSSSAAAAKSLPEKAPDVGQSNATHVEVIRPKVGDMDRTTTQPGTVQSYESASLFAGVSGYLRTQTVDIGDRVEAGQILATVDVPDLDKQVQRTSAALDQTRARVLQMKARAVSARAEQDAARAAIPRAEALLKSKSAELRYQQQRLQRIRELAASRSVEDKLVDEYTSHRDAVREAEIAAQESVTSAKANLAAMAAKVQAADADVQEAEAEVKVAQAELEKAQVMVKFATIVAPFKGVITHRSFFPGDYVRAATEGGTHAPLLTIERTDRMRVVVQVPDRDVPYTDPGDPAVVELDALPGEKLPIAKVSRIARSEDPQTRLMHVEIDVPNPTGRICQGMYGRVKIILQKSDLLSVPSSCLIERSETGKAYAYVVRDGVARRVQVRVSDDNGLKVGIVSGLKATDDVVVRPGPGLTDGTPVEAAHAEETVTK